MSWLPYITMFLLGLVGTMLIFIILLQRGRGGGLAGALGGMGGQSAFGTKAGDVFTRITIGLAAVWMLLAAGNVYALRFTGKLYDGGSEAVKEAGALESGDKKKDGEASDDDIKNAAHGLMGIGDKKDEKAEDAKPADDKKPADEPKSDEKKADETKSEPAKEDAAKPDEKTEKSAEAAAKADEKKPE